MVGNWGIGEACRQAAVWREQGRALRVGVSLFAEQLQVGNLVATVQAALEIWGLPPAALEFELTETVALHHDDEALGPLHALHAWGSASPSTMSAPATRRCPPSSAARLFGSASTTASCRAWAARVTILAVQLTGATWRSSRRSWRSAEGWASASGRKGSRRRSKQLSSAMRDRATSLRPSLTGRGHARVARRLRCQRPIEGPWPPSRSADLALRAGPRRCDGAQPAPETPETRLLTPTLAHDHHRRRPDRGQVGRGLTRVRPQQDNASAEHARGGAKQVGAGRQAALSQPQPDD